MALLTGYRRYVLEASVHTRPIRLVYCVAPDTKQAHSHGEGLQYMRKA